MKRPRATPTPICPLCGNPAQRDKRKAARLWKCCGLWGWDGAPLADKATHAARSAARKALTRLWKGGNAPCARREALREVAAVVGISVEELDFDLMGEERAHAVRDACAAVRERFRPALFDLDNPPLS